MEVVDWWITSLIAVDGWTWPVGIVKDLHVVDY